MSIILRNVKESPLTYDELDGNFITLSQSYATTGSNSFNGKQDINGNVNITGSLRVTSGITSSLYGTASYAKVLDGLGSSQFVQTSSSQTIYDTKTFYDPLVLGLEYGLDMLGSTGKLIFNASDFNDSNVQISIGAGQMPLPFPSVSIDRGDLLFYDNSDNVLAGLHQNGTGFKLLSGNFIGNLTGNATTATTSTTSATSSFAVSSSRAVSASFSSNTLLLNNTASSTFATTGSNSFNGKQTVIGNVVVTGSLYLDGDTGSLYINDNKQFNYISLSYLQTINIDSSTPTSFQYDTLDSSRGITYTGSQIYFEHTGVYNIQFSAQFKFSNNTLTHIWFKKNGNNIDNSASIINNGNTNYMIAAWNFVHTFESGSNVEIYCKCDKPSELVYETSSIDISAVPSIIVTVTQVS